MALAHLTNSSHRIFCAGSGFGVMYIYTEINLYLGNV